MSDINDNIISWKWQERCSRLPADVRERFDKPGNSPPSEYQLRMIKCSRAYPEIGDVFKIKQGTSDGEFPQKNSGLCSRDRHHHGGRGAPPGKAV